MTGLAGADLVVVIVVVVVVVVVVIVVVVVVHCPVLKPCDLPVDTDLYVEPTVMKILDLVSVS